MQNLNNTIHDIHNKIGQYDLFYFFNKSKNILYIITDNIDDVYDILSKIRYGFTICVIPKHVVKQYDFANDYNILSLNVKILDFSFISILKNNEEIIKQFKKCI